MTTFTNAWTQDIETQLIKALKNAKHEKGSGKNHPKIRHADYFPKRKPGEGGFDPNSGKGKGRDRGGDDAS